MSKLFVRERRQVGAGAGQPRFRIVASEGLNMRIYVPHMRRIELEQLATASGAEIIYLARGDQDGEQGHEPGQRHRRGGDHGQGSGQRHGQNMQDQD
jgi:hypothetical protein